MNPDPWVTLYQLVKRAGMPEGADSVAKAILSEAPAVAPPIVHYEARS